MSMICPRCYFRGCAGNEPGDLKHRLQWRAREKNSNERQIQRDFFQRFEKLLDKEEEVQSDSEHCNSDSDEGSDDSDSEHCNSDSDEGSDDRGRDGKGNGPSVFEVENLHIHIHKGKPCEQKRKGSISIRISSKIKKELQLVLA